MQDAFGRLAVSAQDAVEVVAREAETPGIVGLAAIVATDTAVAIGGGPCGLDGKWV